MLQQSHEPGDGRKEPADELEGPPEGAHQWVGVYRELLTFEEEVLDEVKRRMETLSPLARERAEAAHLPALREDRARYQERLKLWQRRLTDLDARPPVA